MAELALRCLSHASGLHSAHALHPSIVQLHLAHRNVELMHITHDAAQSHLINQEWNICEGSQQVPSWLLPLHQARCWCLLHGSCCPQSETACSDTPAPQNNIQAHKRRANEVVARHSQGEDQGMQSITQKLAICVGSKHLALSHWYTWAVPESLLGLHLLVVVMPAGAQWCTQLVLVLCQSLPSSSHCQGFHTADLGVGRGVVQHASKLILWEEY